MAPVGTDLPLVHLVLLAGGRGERCGGEVPKQFALTPRGPLFSISLKTFLGGSGQAGYRMGVVVVTADGAFRETVAGELEAIRPGGRWLQADPGATRTASTRSALDALARMEPGSADLVAVHDAARPFATAGLMGSLVRSAAASGGAVPGVPVPDTVVRDDPSGVSYLPREILLAVQTPQVFRWNLLDDAHRWAASQGRSFTDDGGLLACRDHAPAVIPGEVGNWKVTTSGDLQRARALLGV